MSDVSAGKETLCDAREEAFHEALKTILREAEVVGDDPYADIYIERLGRIEDIARGALAK